jgi:hypothetical protein
MAAMLKAGVKDLRCLVKSVKRLLLDRVKLWITSYDLLHRPMPDLSQSWSSISRMYINGICIYVHVSLA